MDAGEKYWNIKSEREIDCELNKKSFHYCDGLELIYVHVLAWFLLRGWEAPGVHGTIVNVNERPGVASLMPWTPHHSYSET